MKIKTSLGIGLILLSNLSCGTNLRVPYFYPENEPNIRTYMFDFQWIYFSCMVHAGTFEWESTFQYAYVAYKIHGNVICPFTAEGKLSHDNTLTAEMYNQSLDPETGRFVVDAAIDLDDLPQDERITYQWHLVYSLVPGSQDVAEITSDVYQTTFDIVWGSSFGFEGHDYKVTPDDCN